MKRRVNKIINKKCATTRKACLSYLGNRNVLCEKLRPITHLAFQHNSARNPAGNVVKKLYQIVQVR